MPLPGCVVHLLPPREHGHGSCCVCAAGDEDTSLKNLDEDAAANLVEFLRCAAAAGHYLFITSWRSLRLYVLVCLTSLLCPFVQKVTFAALTRHAPCSLHRRLRSFYGEGYNASTPMDTVRELFK